MRIVYRLFVVGRSGALEDCFRAYSRYAYATRELAEREVPAFLRRCEDGETHLDYLEPGSGRVKIEEIEVKEEGDGGQVL
jgi:hypothetical protein